MPLYTIFMQRIANEMESRGFPVIKIAPNRKNPKYVVYMFEDTVEFRKTLNEILHR